MIRITAGFAFIVFGTLWSWLNQYSCNSLCNLCTTQQLSPCYFLFIFVGIIFIITGTSLVLTGNKILSEDKKLKK